MRHSFRLVAARSRDSLRTRCTPSTLSRRRRHRSRYLTRARSCCCMSKMATAANTAVARSARSRARAEMAAKNRPLDIPSSRLIHTHHRQAAGGTGHTVSPNDESNQTTGQARHSSSSGGGRRSHRRSTVRSRPRRSAQVATTAAELSASMAGQIRSQYSGRSLYSQYRPCKPGIRTHHRHRRIHHRS